VAEKVQKGRAPRGGRGDTPKEWVGAVAVGAGSPKVASAFVAREHPWRCREQLSPVVTHLLFRLLSCSNLVQQEQGWVLQKSIRDAFSFPLVFPLDVIAIVACRILTQHPDQDLAVALASFPM